MSTKQIHIEKYDFDAFEKEQKPYVMVLTELIQKFPMKHSQELLLWMFLESLPPTWKPNKQHIMAHFNISARTYERYMGYLNTTKLIEYRQERTEDGTFGCWKLIVLNGTKFSPDAASNRSAKIDGTVVNRLKAAKVIHSSASNRSAKFGVSDTRSKTRASIDVSTIQPFRQITVERLNDVHINTTIKNTKERKKTNNIVFADALSVKTHLEKVIGNRGVYVEDEIIDQGVFYSYDKNNDKSFDSVNKRLNIFLKMVREGKWLIPQGWNDITSQSIRVKEEQDHEIKIEQYQQDAFAYREIQKRVISEVAASSLGDMLKKLKTG
jgi:hypothetical protein